MKVTLNNILALDAIGEFIYSEETFVSCNVIFNHIDTSESPLLTSFVSENITKKITSRALEIIHDDRYKNGFRHSAAIKILRQLKEEKHFATPDQEDFVFTKCHIDKDGNKLWKWGDKIHRDDKNESGLTLPAVIRSNGTKYWCKNDKTHRDDKDDSGLTLPAVIWPSGEKFWYRNGKIHRDDKDESGFTLPAIIYTNGTKWWYKNGERIYQ